jgi:S1-C subfamily serine protease
MLRALAAILLATAAAAAQDRVRSSVVRVFATYQCPNHARPWDVYPHDEVTGSGCIIAGNRILTNAHVVSDQTFVQVQRADIADKHVARVAAVSHELDLAVLTVDGDAFFAGAEAVPLGTLPRVGDTVVTLGFPTGGTRLAVTEGVVSRIDRSVYSHSWLENLVCQIDAPINPGSSGGPVLSEGRIAGVAFQTRSGQNIGYMVPAPVVEHFLKDIQDGRLDGSPTLAARWQWLENARLRRHHGMADGQSGVLLTKVAPAFEGEGRLRARDILLGVDEHDVANDGTIEFRPGERIELSHVFDQRQVGESVTLHLLREGKPVDVELKLSEAKTAYGNLVPRLRYETRPSYFIYGGLVFAPLTANYLNEWDEWSDVPIHFRRYYAELRTAENAWREEVVVLIDVLKDQLNAGYGYYASSVVSKVDGTAVASLRHLAELLERQGGETRHILLEESDCEIVLAHEDARRRTPAILERYRVPADRSPDLMAR